MKKKIRNSERKIRLIIFFGILITLMGCKTQQTMSDAITTEPVLPYHTETIVVPDSLKIEKSDYKWISYRASISIPNHELNNLNLFLVNRKDSILFVTVSKMGIEGVRLVLTPDSVKFLNHLSSNCYVGDYSISERLTGIKTDFYIFQSLLTGEPLPENVKSFIQASYGNFTTIDSQSFFQQADFILLKENLLLNMTVKNIKLNVAGPTSIRISEKYTPIRW